MSRRMEKTIVIAVEPEMVWKALTDPKELTRWFPLEAEVVPGPGGSILYSWGPQMQSSHRIDHWEPARRLQLSERLPDGMTLALDFILEGTRGSTTLRLVHEGFRDGSDWSDEFDAFSRGWDYELRSLRHYLERQFGRDRVTVSARRSLPVDMDRAWQLLTGPSGIVPDGFPARIRMDGPVDITLQTGERIKGHVLIWDPMRQFSAVVENMGDALLRLELMRCGGPAEASLWLASYGATGAGFEPREMERRWGDMLRRILAPPSV